MSISFSRTCDILFIRSCPTTATLPEDTVLSPHSPATGMVCSFVEWPRPIAREGLHINTRSRARAVRRAGCCPLYDSDRNIVRRGVFAVHTATRNIDTAVSATTSDDGNLVAASGPCAICPAWLTHNGKSTTCTAGVEIRVRARRRHIILTIAEHGPY